MNRGSISTYLLLLLVAAVGLPSCMVDPPLNDGVKTSSQGYVYDPTYVNLNLPNYFPPYETPADNPLTEQGIKLGRMLFYDPILSADSSLACAGCHNQAYAFTDDGFRFSTGIDGIDGSRNAMSLVNLIYGKRFFWDGRSNSLEEQALEPVPNPIEMHQEWPDAIDKLNKHAHYPGLFYEAFGVEEIDPGLAADAMSQFMRTLISKNSRYDKFIRGELDGTSEEFTDAERRGLELFSTEQADCFHCHGVDGNHQFMELNGAQQFRNNGLDAANSIYDFADPGLGGITGNPDDYGKFKIPSLRNIAVTAPYMHDGRFQTLEQVINFYSEGLHASPTIDPLMKFVGQGGIQLTLQEKQDLIAFLRTLTDEEFLNEPDFSSPFK